MSSSSREVSKIPTNEEQKDGATLEHPNQLLHVYAEATRAKDLSALWFTGCRRLQRLMGAFRGVEELNIEIYSTGPVGAPFGFGGCLSGLRSFRLTAKHHSYRFCRYLDASTDLSALPSTLTHLSITSSNCFSLLLNRDELALHVSPRRYDVKGAKALFGTRFEIVGFQRPTHDASLIFYPLHRLFPNLDTLELLSDMHTDAPEISSWVPRLEWRVCQHLNPDGSPMGDEEYLKNTKFLRRGTTNDPDLERPEEYPSSLSMEIAFFQSLPLSLSKLNLGFDWNWSDLSLAHLPTSVTDLTIFGLKSDLKRPFRRMRNGVRVENEEHAQQLKPRYNDAVEVSANGSDTDSQKTRNTIGLYKLPDSIKRLTIRKGFSGSVSSIRLESLPRQLISLNIGNIDLLNQSKLPETLIELNATAALTSWNLLPLLPHGISVLKLDTNASVAMFSTVPDSVIVWPATLTDLDFSVPLVHVSTIFSSFLPLPLVRLRLNIDLRSIYLAVISSGDIANLPRTLKTLKLLDATLSSEAWRVLPPHLTTLTVFTGFWSIDHRVWTHTLNMTDIPSSLTKLKCSVSTRLHPENLPNFYRPGLRKLVLAIHPLTPITTTLPTPLEILPSTLLELHLTGPYCLSPQFTSNLPRTLVSLFIESPDEHLSSTDLLPRGLHTLKVSCYLMAPDIGTLPRGLTDLKFKYRARACASEAELRMDKVLAVSTLPRSLTCLMLLSLEFVFSEELSVHLPAGLVTLTLPGPNFTALLGSKYPRQLMRSSRTTTHHYYHY